MLDTVLTPCSSAPGPLPRKNTHQFELHVRPNQFSGRVRPGTAWPFIGSTPRPQPGGDHAPASGAAPEPRAEGRRRPARRGAATAPGADARGRSQWRPLPSGGRGLRPPEGAAQGQRSHRHHRSQREAASKRPGRRRRRCLLTERHCLPVGAAVPAGRWAPLGPAARLARAPP